MPVPIVAALNFLAQYVPLVGWTTVAYWSYRVGRFFARIEARFLLLEENINKAMTNELPHIQAAMNQVLEAITDLRDEFRFLIQSFSHR